MLQQIRPYAGPFVATVIVGAVAYFSMAPMLQQPAPRQPIPVTAAASTPVTRSCLKQPTTGLKIVGVGGCGISPCHGSAGKRKGKIWHNERALWSIKDKAHSQANKTLSNERSAGILKLLGATRNSAEFQNCQKCHDPMMVEPTEAGRAFTQGVTCESCHGPAERWVSTHTNGGGGVGLQKTENLLTRARICADCHVGAADREVNHDLIAAGHPALKFDFGSFMAMMPKHWDYAAERRAPDYEVQAWAAGQIASADAALELLESQSAKAKANTADAIWPEFSEMNCYACHHDLAWPSWRQQRGYSVDRRSGLPAWGTWTFTSLETLTSQDTASAKGRAFGDSLASVRDILESSPAPDAAEVHKRAVAARAALCGWADLSGGPTRMGITSNRVAALLNNYGQAESAEGADKTVANWETATQIYLTALVVHIANLQKGAKPGDTEISQLLGKVRTDLGYLEGYDSPKAFLGETGDEPGESRRARIRDELLDIITRINKR